MDKKTSHPQHDQLQIDDKRVVPLSDSNTHSDSLEVEYADNVHKELFFELCNEFRIPVGTMFTKILSLREKHRLNIFLRTIKEKYGIRIMDCLIYLEDKYARFNQLLKCLDQENEYTLKSEAAEINERYKIQTNHLKDFLEFSK